MIVREKLFEKDQLQLSAGLVIIQGRAILLAHPKGSDWWGTYSIPKGHVEEGEDLLEAAIRETREEVGVTIHPDDIVDREPEFIDYKDKNGLLYKRVYYFIARPPDPIPRESILPDREEVDWAGFISKEKANQRIFWRFLPVLENID